MRLLHQCANKEKNKLHILQWGFSLYPTPYMSTYLLLCYDALRFETVWSGYTFEYIFLSIIINIIIYINHANITGSYDNS